MVYISYVPDGLETKTIEPFVPGKEALTGLINEAKGVTKATITIHKKTREIASLNLPFSIYIL